jgi:SAM-dependent methyltransferase
MHFLAMQPEYEAMLRWVGIQSNWRVLDAACGNGSFLPLLTELVGPQGQVDAIDLAPENVQVVTARTAQSQWCTPVTTRVGSILTLPYADQSFDAVWCANTTQYLTNEEVHTALREFRRVVRPGGLIAIKEYDATAQQFQPTPPFLIWHRQEALCRAGSQYAIQVLRTINLAQWLRAAGLLDIRQKPELMVRFSPLRPSEKAFICAALQHFYQEIQNIDLPPEELQVWQQLAEIDSPNHITHHPDFQYRTIQTVFVGRVP